MYIYIQYDIIDPPIYIHIHTYIYTHKYIYKALDKNRYRFIDSNFIIINQ